jgi:hypothetical protein
VVSCWRFLQLELPSWMVSSNPWRPLFLPYFKPQKTPITKPWKIRFLNVSKYLISQRKKFISLPPPPFQPQKNPPKHNVSNLKNPLFQTPKKTYFKTQLKPYFKPQKILFLISKNHVTNNLVCVNDLGDLCKCKTM